MTTRTDENILSEKQLRKSNEQLNQVRPLLVEYPRKLEDLKKNVHTIKIRHVAETSKLKRRYKEELDRKVQEAREEEREIIRKEMEDLKNESERNKTRWMAATSKLKIESNRLERAHERLNRAESLTQGNRVELQRSVELLKKEVQRNHRDLVNLEREKRLERIRADREEERARRLENKLDSLTRGRLHHRTVAAEERASSLEHRHTVLEWKFKTLFNVVNDLYRQGTPPSFEEVHTLQDLLDNGNEGYSRFPEIPEARRQAKVTDRGRGRRRRPKSPETTRLPEIAGAESSRKSPDISDEEKEEKLSQNDIPKTPDADTESLRGSPRPQSRKSDESATNVQDDVTVTSENNTQRKDETADDRDERPAGDDETDDPKEKVFLTEQENTSDENVNARDGKDEKEMSARGDSTDKAKVDGKEGNKAENTTIEEDREEMEREEYEKQLAALKKKRTMKKKK
ncbi:uncharacterized protein LOC144451486 isoform X2 [Glandiceps talaboti]